MYSALLDPFCCLILFCLFMLFKRRKLSHAKMFLSTLRVQKRQNISESMRNVQFCCQSFRNERHAASFQTWHYTYREKNKSCTEQEKKSAVSSGGQEINDDALEAAGHTAVLSIIKLPQERLFSSSTRSPCCHVAFSRVLSVGFTIKHLKHAR